MTAAARTHRPPRPSALPVSLLDPAARRVRVEVVRWALAHGRPLSADALTAVLAAKAARGSEPTARWQVESVRELVWSDVLHWCRQCGVAVPARLPETLWTLLDWLEATGGFAPGSDPLALLREPLCDSAGLDRRGRPRATSDARAAKGSRGRHPSAQPLVLRPRAARPRHG
jgi:hypothetical protein